MASERFLLVDNVPSNCIVLHVKLTDSSLKCLENYRNDHFKKNLLGDMKIKLEANQGVLSVPSTENSRSFSFNLSSLPSNDASTECFLQSNKKRCFQNMGIINQKIIIRASDDVYQNTMEKISNTNLEIKKNCTKEIKLKGSSKKASNSVNAKLHRLMEARKNRPPEEKKKFHVAGNFTADRRSLPQQPKKVFKPPVKDESMKEKVSPIKAASTETSAPEEAPNVPVRSVKQEPLPMKHQAVPVKQQQLPAKQQKLPVKPPSSKDHNLSAKDHNLSAKDHSLSAKDHNLSAKDQSLPVKEQSLPAKEQKLPVKKQQTPAKETSPSEQALPVKQGSSRARISTQEEYSAAREEFDQKYKVLSSLNIRIENRLKYFNSLVKKFKETMQKELLEPIYNEHAFLTNNDDHRKEKDQFNQLHAHLSALKKQIQEFKPACN